MNFRPTLLEELHQLYSDIHKDAYGFRPRGLSDEFLADETALRAAIADAERALEVTIRREREDEARAIAAFERRVASTMEAGAADRATAIRWLREAAGEMSVHDADYFCWENGLPFGYIAKGLAG